MYLILGGGDGALAVSKINVDFGTFRLPEDVSFDEGTFIEPLGTVIRTQRLANLKENQTLLVIGSGISGLMHINLAKSKNVRKIVAVDINEYRLDAAKKLGADGFIAKPVMTEYLENFLLSKINSLRRKPK